MGADCAQSEAGVRGAVVSEDGRTGASPRSVVRPHRVAALHPATAAHDPGLSSQLNTEAQHFQPSVVGTNWLAQQRNSKRKKKT